MTTQQIAFQTKFNQIIAKKNLAGSELKKAAIRFYNYCRRNVKDSDHCPFPYYLETAYLKTING